MCHDYNTYLVLEFSVCYSTIIDLFLIININLKSMDSFLSLFFPGNKAFRALQSVVVFQNNYPPLTMSLFSNGPSSYALDILFQTNLICLSSIHQWTLLFQLFPFLTSFTHVNQTLLAFVSSNNLRESNYPFTYVFPINTTRQYVMWKKVYNRELGQI